MKYSIFFFSMFASCSAFQNVKTQTRNKPTTSSFEFYGDIEPLGFFDPLQITTNCEEKTLKYMREAEIHHGRIAMVASLLLPLIDHIETDKLAINALSQSGSLLNNVALGSMGFFELARMTSLYKPPRQGLFELKNESQPGKLNPYTKLDVNRATKELSNGRLAMIGVVGYMVQELVSNEKIFY
jgi:hypothetical protein